jgi:hypothetical protein
MGDYLHSICQRGRLLVDRRTPLASEIARRQRQLAAMACQMRGLLRSVYSDNDVNGYAEHKVQSMHELRQRMLATRLQIAELKFQDAARN